MVDSTWSARAALTCDGSIPVQKAPHALALCFRVMTDEPRVSAITGSAAILGAVFCAALGWAEPVLAGPVDSLRQALSHRPSDGQDVAAASVGRYVSEDGDVFTLDRTGSKALLKFDAGFEVWALTPQQAPRGDTIYKNDLGEPVLRATRLGGLTIFTDHRPDGEAAALVGVGNPLKLAIMGPQALFERLAQAAIRTSHAVHRGISFEGEATPVSSALMADAALVASEALIRMSKRSDGHRFVDRIQRVRFVEGRKAAAELSSEGVLLITLAPPQGQAGRPSSDRIQRQFVQPVFNPN